MVLDTNTKKPHRHKRSSFEHLMDVYWGGSERRITGLTLRIMGINTLCIAILMLGALNFGQYETNIIASKLKAFQTQATLIADSLGALDFEAVDHAALQNNLTRIQSTTHYEIIVTRPDHSILSQTRATDALLQALSEDTPNTKILTLKDFFGALTGLLPNRDVIPSFPLTDQGLPDLQTALSASDSLQVWRQPDGQLLLAAMVPVYAQDTPKAQLYILRSGQDIVKDIRYFWQQIFYLFLLTLLATVVISIYLSGLIARPLRQLSRTAEQIRRKKTRAIEIPDLSNRHDEIGELSLVMRDMTESLWTRLDSIEQFAADVAHELKNPLTSLKSAIETLKIVKKKSDQKQLLDILQQDVERMDRLISDISLASRLDAELSREKYAPIDVAILLKKIIHRYQTHFSDTHNIQLYLPDHDQSLLVETSEGRITQVFDNLLDNALSFSPKGGHVSVTALQKQNTITVMVDDDGPGIPIAKLDTIFDRFYSERRGNGQFGQHSGLGLAICKQIVRADGGTIHAENKPSGGARFIVTFMAAT